MVWKMGQLPYFGLVADCDMTPSYYCMEIGGIGTQHTEISVSHLLPCSVRVSGTHAIFLFSIKTFPQLMECLSFPPASSSHTLSPLGDLKPRGRHKTSASSTPPRIIQ